MKVRLSEEETVQRYKAGESVTILAKAVGSSHMLYNILERHHVPLRTKSKREKSDKEISPGVPKSKPVYSGSQMVVRGIELAPISRWLYDYWKRNPQSRPYELIKALKDETGEIVARTTLRRWLKKWREGEVPKAPKEAPTITKKPAPPLDEKDPVAIVEDFLSEAKAEADKVLNVIAGLEKLMAEVRQLRREKEEWQKRAQSWSAKLVELQNEFAQRD